VLTVVDCLHVKQQLELASGAHDFNEAVEQVYTPRYNQLDVHSYIEIATYLQLELASGARDFNEPVEQVYTPRYNQLDVHSYIETARCLQRELACGAYEAAR